MVNVICMKWGKLYNADYVNKLYNSVKKHLTIEFKFFCFTDNSEGLSKEIIAMSLPNLNIPEDKKISPWLKLAVYQKNFGNLSGKTLFLDLDIVIVDNINCLVDFSNKYSIAENWSQLDRDVGNSSVFCFNIGEYSYIYDEFAKDPVSITSKYDNEQIYASTMLGEKKVFYPKEWIKSFKRHSIAKSLFRFFIEPKISESSKIIAFHGHPKPHEALLGVWPKKIIPYMKQAKWIDKYWQ